MEEKILGKIGEILKSEHYNYRVWTRFLDLLNKAEMDLGQERNLCVGHFHAMRSDQDFQDHIERMNDIDNYGKFIRELRSALSEKIQEAVETYRAMLEERYNKRKNKAEK